MEKVHQSVRSSLKSFTVQEQAEPYLDSLVMHSPLDTTQETLTAWRTLESYVPHQIRNLGISNVTLPILQAITREATVKPAVVQNRFHDHTGYEVDLRAFCKENDIIFQSFWTLSANPALVKSSPVANVARETGVDIPAAYYSLVLGLEGVTILDGTTNEGHMREDLEGIEKIGVWADGEGATSWAAALAEFKAMIGEE